MDDDTENSEQVQRYDSLYMNFYCLVAKGAES